MDIEQIQKHFGFGSIVSRLLWERGYREIIEIEKLLKPELSQLPSPFQIIDMKKAVVRTASAIESGEKIVIYGDYDVDGTCGASVLIDFFRQLGIDPQCYQPNRFSEGYGVNVSAVKKLIDEGARVLITVDCGITAVEPASVVKDSGVDMIVLDHHKLGQTLPSAFAVVDPQRPEDISGLRNLCGAGLAFFFAMGCRHELRTRGYFSNGRREPNLLTLLDLVAVATVADIVDIRGVNRILVSHGLKVLEKNPRPGFKAILETEKIQRPSTTHCGFVLGPRINAAGRLKSARAAFDLLTSVDLESARVLARELHELNLERRQTQDAVHSAARVQALKQLEDVQWKKFQEKIPASKFGPWPRALVLAPETNEKPWHEGVVGIVASKIVEEFGVPTIVLTRHGDNGLKGSMRSIPKVDILAAISAESVSKHLTNFGGHAHAGGVTLKENSLDDFRIALNEHMAITLSQESFVRERRFDLEVHAEEINEKLLLDLEALEPFGQGFLEPVFKLINAGVEQVIVMKEKHLKLRLKQRFDAIWFNALKENSNDEIARVVPSGCALWVSPQWNEWQGTRKLQLRITHAEA